MMGGVDKQNKGKSSVGRTEVIDMARNKILEKCLLIHLLLNLE